MTTGSAEPAEHALQRMLGSDGFLDALPVGICCCDRSGVIHRFNRRAVELWGGSPRAGDTRARYSVFHKLFDGEGRALAPEETPMAKVLRSDAALHDQRLLVERADGIRLVVLADVEPLHDASGALVGAVSCFQDVTERHRAEMEAAHLAAIVSSSDDAIIGKTLDGIVRSWNDGATHIFGYAADEMIGQPIMRIIPPELQGEETEILARLPRGERIDPFETVRLTRDGNRIDVSLTVSPVHDRSGRIVGASKVARDISERKKAEELQRLLLGELNHRVKNTLATVQSMASQTARFTKDPAAFAARFAGRIRALAQAHDLLTRNAWKGADVGAVARAQLRLDGIEDGRVSCTGPALSLAPQPALHLGLVLHELGTNARKHGALSVPEGRLSVRWTVDDGMLALHWRESGGPTVAAPDARGFGSTLIERSLAGHGGATRVDYRPEGLTCDLTLPLPERTGVRAGPFATLSRVAPEPPTRPPATDRGLCGKRILVVEDEPLIGMEVVETLARAGCVPLGPAPTLESARQLVEAGGIDAALLDANLGGEPVDDLAMALDRRDVPFAFLTGYGRDSLPVAFPDVPRVDKPFTRESTLDIVAGLVRRAGSPPHVDPAAG